MIPLPEYGPEPYYGLNGAVSVPQIERDLDTLHALGFQAVTVQAGYNMPFAYLSKEYFAFFRSFVAAAKERNMRVWIVDDAGYPSGFAGGKFTLEKPELRMQALEVAEKIPVAAGTTLHRDLPAAMVSAAAVDGDGNAIADFSQGRLTGLDCSGWELDGSCCQITNFALSPDPLRHECATREDTHRNRLRTILTLRRRSNICSSRTNNTRRKLADEFE